MLAQDGFEFNFNKKNYSIYLQNKLIAWGLLIDNFYHLLVDANVNLNKQIMSAVGQKRLRDKFNHKYLWHHRLDHIGEDSINWLKKDGILDLIKFESILACESCLQKKWLGYPLWDKKKGPLSY